jgi:hypothetical protein
MYYNESEKYVSLPDELKKLSIIFLWSLPLMFITILIINFLLS